MAETLAALKEASLLDQVKVMVGGAPVTQAFADELGADGYSAIAGIAVEKAKALTAQAATAQAAAATRPEGWDGQWRNRHTLIERAHAMAAERAKLCILCVSAKGGEMMRRVRSSRLGHGWWPFLILALVLVGGIFWGLASALAASPAASPSSSAGKVVLRLGWTVEPDNLNVFIGYAEPNYEIWALNYDYLFGMNINNQAELDLAS